VAIFIRLRDTRADAERTLSPVELGIRFEREIADVLRKAKIQPDMSANNRGVDFIVEINGRRIGIVVKTWSKATPRGMAWSSIRRLRETRTSLALDDLVVVTTEMPAWVPETETDGVRIISRHELAAYLSRAKADSGNNKGQSS
jgi:hypothetical protein